MISNSLLTVKEQTLNYSVSSLDCAHDGALLIVQLHLRHQTV